MFGLAPNQDLSFFHNRTLIQVCIGSNELILHFDDDVSITVTSAVGWTTPLKKHSSFEEFRLAGAAVSSALDDVVSTASGDANGTLCLEFRSGAKLEFYDSSKEYESYLIRHGEKVIVV